MMRAPEGFSLVMGFTMATVIVLLGAVMMFTDFYIDVIKKPNRTYLAFIFFAYGAYRYLRAWQTYKKARQEKQREEWEKEKKRDFK